MDVSREEFEHLEDQVEVLVQNLATHQVKLDRYTEQMSFSTNRLNESISHLDNHMVALADAVQRAEYRRSLPWFRRLFS